ncbi:MAG: putative rane protein [Myxococcaceae bacterium]|nr:putative rane protein [Myxococcaceae bacterium]
MHDHQEGHTAAPMSRIRGSLRSAANMVALAVIAMAGATHASAQSPYVSPLFQNLGNGPGRPLRGWADLHTHPMSHLGFGGHLMDGAPDVGATLPSGQRYSSEGSLFNGIKNCNVAPVAATNISDALGSCRSTHGGFNADGNNCGNDIRRIVLDKFEDGRMSNKPHDVVHPDGAPTFVRWPKWNDVMHQQMWIDWIRRAHQGGMRVMVSLAVNSYTFGKGLQGNEPLDDKTSGEAQLLEMRAMVGRNPFMEIATSAAHLRRIVEADRLAVILGVELDDIDNLVIRPGETAPTRAEVTGAVTRLRDDLLVRYVFPVHVTDNYFGGAAAYESDFMIANKLQFGSFMSLRCAQPADQVSHRISTDLASPFKSLLAGVGGATQPLPTCNEGVGHVNSRGLQPMGQVLIETLIASGMLIDLDHMSQQTVDDTLARFPHYPFASGHNGLRQAGPDVDEKSRTAAQYRAISRQGGIAGVGLSEATAQGFIDSVRRVAALGVPVAIGSDINGIVKMPPPPSAGTGRAITYGPSFPQASQGSRSWNYNTEGVAHIGLFPDFLRDVELSGGTDVVKALFDAPEALARTWERAELQNRVLHVASGGSGGAALDTKQAAPNGTFGSAVSLGGAGFSRLAAAAHNDGRLEIFAIDASGAVSLRWQNAATSGWYGAGFTTLGGSELKNLVALTTDADRIELFALGGDGAIYHRYQTNSAGDWSPTWASLGGSGLKDLTAVKNSDGRLELFVVGGDGVAYERWQTSPGGGWNPEGFVTRRGAGLTRVYAGVQRDRRLLLVGLDRTGAVSMVTQSAVGGSWPSTWSSLGGTGFRELALAADADGRIEVFGLRPDGSVVSRFQTAALSWNAEGWQSLGGSAIAHIAAAQQADGALYLLAVGGDSRVYARKQTVPNGGWNADGWSALAGSSGLPLALVLGRPL